MPTKKKKKNNTTSPPPTRLHGSVQYNAVLGGPVPFRRFLEEEEEETIVLHYQVAYRADRIPLLLLRLNNKLLFIVLLIVLCCHWHWHLLLFLQDWKSAQIGEWKAQTLPTNCVCRDGRNCRQCAKCEEEDERCDALRWWWSMVLLFVDWCVNCTQQQQQEHKKSWAYSIQKKENN